jgi:hypothetical protein
VRTAPAETGLGKAHAFLRQLNEVGILEARLQDHRTGDHPHAAGPQGGEATLRGDGKRLDPFHVARPSRHMHFRRGNAGGHPAMQVALEIPDGALARRVITEGDVHVGIDQSGNGGHAVGVDHHIGACHRLRGCRADGLDALAVGEDRVAVNERIAPVAGDDAAEIDDGNLHGRDVVADAPSSSRSS